MPAFECLYILENYYLQIIGVKRLWPPQDVQEKEKFHWMKIDKQTLSIIRLNLRSMDSAGEIEKRYFEEGFLKFNRTIGTFIEKYNSAQHPMQHNGCHEL